MVKTKKLKKSVVVLPLRSARKRPAKAVSLRKVRPASTNADAIRADLLRNAMAFVNSLYHPFQGRDVRLPTADGIPSTVGSFQERITLPLILNGETGFRESGAALYPAFSYNGNPNMPIRQLTANDTIGSTWDNREFTNILALAANFKYIRAVSMGVRIINTAARQFRGGTLYLGFFQGKWPPEALGITPPSFLQNFRASNETLEVDLGELPSGGKQFVWLPLSCNPGPPVDSDGSYDTASTCVTWSKPQGVSELSDNRMILHAVCDGSLVSDVVNLEIIVNWEAIPFQQTEYLFDRQSIMGSQDDIAVAFEKAGKQGVDDAIWSAVSDSVVNAGKGVIKAGLIGGFRGALGAAKGLLSQVPSAMRRVGRGVLSSMSSEEFALHAAALHLGCPAASPEHAVCEEKDGDPPSLRDLRLRLAAHLIKIADDESKVQTSPPAGEDPPVPGPPSLTRQEAGPPPGAAASAVAGLATAQRTPLAKWSIVPRF
jgi:hypothetical protein